MKIAKTFLKLLVLSLFVTANSAQAASIQNLSDRTQTVEVKGESGEYETVTIDSWRDYSRPGMLRVRFAGHEATIQPDEQFAIWSDSSIGPQRRGGRFHK